ncbi:hypothetical protein [Polyangium aurulentum]|uniref:hypothetical protein n=1 Tax=Polyangium aurulentum TaxID=2567896 RepID=UPI00200EA41C|nr:hypothetical protein [Polyangium aurulentum]UQA59864.1 hypothetical protein E8A73_005025 [Polyangium aurulentum]
MGGFTGGFCPDPLEAWEDEAEDSLLLELALEVESLPEDAPLAVLVADDPPAPPAPLVDGGLASPPPHAGRPNERSASGNDTNQLDLRFE